MDCRTGSTPISRVDEKESIGHDVSTPSPAARQANQPQTSTSSAPQLPGSAYSFPPAIVRLLQMELTDADRAAVKKTIEEGLKQRQYIRLAKDPLVCKMLDKREKLIKHMAKRVTFHVILFSGENEENRASA